MTQTMFGLMIADSKFPLAPELARALAERITAATQLLNAGAPAAQAAELRRDAEHYLAARRRRDLRLPPFLERTCDDGARAVLRGTVGIPPLPVRSELLVA